MEGVSCAFQVYFHKLDLILAKPLFFRVLRALSVFRDSDKKGRKNFTHPFATEAFNC